MACRHISKCETAAKEIRATTNNKRCVCKFLDLASFDSVEKFVKDEVKGYTPIVLILKLSTVICTIALII